MFLKLLFILPPTYCGAADAILKFDSYLALHSYTLIGTSSRIWDVGQYILLSIARISDRCQCTLRTANEGRLNRHFWASAVHYILLGSYYTYCLWNLSYFTNIRTVRLQILFFYYMKNQKILKYLGCSIYRISSYSFRGNYSFLNLEIQRSQYIRPKVTVHKCAETIQGRKL